jgi:hypothetical protein
MILLARGTGTSTVEVTHVSSHGIWLLAHDEEHFLAYEDFPWFMEKPLRSILNVEEPVTGHFYWPDMDVDLSLDIIPHPENYPLKADNSLKVSNQAEGAQ